MRALAPHIPSHGPKTDGLEGGPSECLGQSAAFSITCSLLSFLTAMFVVWFCRNSVREGQRTIPLSEFATVLLWNFIPFSEALWACVRQEGEHLSPHLLAAR